MGESTGITWTHHTFNHVWGCKKISSECKHCYAETRVKKFNADYWNGSYRIFEDKHWNEPLLWDKKAAKDGVRRRVFCASMADFADIDSPESERIKLWEVIRKTPNLDWLLLTKRPENIVGILPEDWGDGYNNVALGVTVGTKSEGYPRLDILRSIPAKMKFISAEPLLEDLEDINLTGFDWLIVGGESGQKARLMEPSWALHLVSAGRKAGLAVFFKQWGEYVPIVKTGFNEWSNVADGTIYSSLPSFENSVRLDDGVVMVRDGKYNIPDTIWGEFIHEEPVWLR